MADIIDNSHLKLIEVLKETILFKDILLQQELEV